MTRTWLVTGASRGLGRALVETVLEAGETVVATARDPEALTGLRDRYGDRAVPLALDVTDRAAVFDVVGRAAEATGRIDVLVNNAGHGLAGGVEEVGEEQARRQMDVNFFGALWCAQAVLPTMRRQRSGHILQLSSIAGIATYPNLGMYCASKWALEGLSETLAQEVASFGVRVTIVEPGEFRTDWSAGSMDRAAPMPEYDEVLAKRRHGLSGVYAHLQPGDPRLFGPALLKILDAAEPPLRVLLGGAAADLAPLTYRRRLEEWARWDDLARTTDGEARAPRACPPTPTDDRKAVPMTRAPEPLRKNDVGDFVSARLFSDIQQFYARQMNLLDGAEPDNEAWAATFTEDAVFDANIDPEPTVGRPAILASVSGATARIFATDLDFRHWIGMLDIEEQEDGSLRTRYYALGMATPRGGSLAFRGHTVGMDHLVHRDGRWLVRHRYLAIDGTPS